MVHELKPKNQPFELFMLLLNHYSKHGSKRETKRIYDNMLKGVRFD